MCWSQLGVKGKNLALLPWKGNIHPLLVGWVLNWIGSLLWCGVEPDKHWECAQVQGGKVWRFLEPTVIERQPHCPSAAFQECLKPAITCF